MHLDDFLNWFDMVDHVFQYSNPLEQKRAKNVGYQDAKECFLLMEIFEKAT